ncbi:MAG: hypothetical protein QM743_11235 [Chitinophagaceae bacterium]
MSSSSSFRICRSLLLVTGLLLFSLNSSFAQALGGLNPTRKSPAGPTLYAGIKIGANFSYLSGTDWSNGVKSNLLGGLFGGVRGAGFGVQGEALFEQSVYTTGDGFYNAFKSNYANTADSLKQGRFRVNKLVLPILLQFRVAHLVWIQPGVQFYGIVSVNDVNGVVNDAKKLFRSGSMAGVMGATVRLGNVDMGARLIFDVQDLSANSAISNNWKQYMIQAHIGLSLF